MITNNKRYFSMARAVELQDTAKTVKELDERFERSCTLCSKAGYCDENKCFVAQAHYTKKEVLKFRELIAAGKIKAPSTAIMHTRAYKKSERFDKGTIQRLLTIASKKRISNVKNSNSIRRAYSSRWVIIKTPIWF